MTDAIADPETRDPAELRNALVDRLVEIGIITAAPVEQAFRTVPRHLFVPPGTPLTTTYDVDRSIPTKTNEHGVTISSISSAYIQARMIEQAEVGPGDRV